MFSTSMFDNQSVIIIEFKLFYQQGENKDLLQEQSRTIDCSAFGGEVGDREGKCNLTLAG